MKQELAKLNISKTVAPEDVSAGDYVMLMHVVWELPSFLWGSDEVMHSREELVRLSFMPPKEDCLPLKVEAVCLPFVQVVHPSGHPQMLDLRRVRLAWLTRSFGKHSWKTFKRQFTEQRERFERFRRPHSHDRNR
jgi:hypothetical protein